MAMRSGRLGSRRGGLFVGRSAELATLEALIVRAAAGQASVILISGEPGVGKSRLLAEATADGAPDAMRWLQGYALEGGGLTPYYPLSQALGPALRAAVRDGDRTIAALAPVLAAGGIGRTDATIPLPPSLPPATERLRLFEAIVAVCEALSERRPLGIALDDLQWSDAATWEALTYAARALGDARVLLLIAVREEALHTPGPAPRAIDELNRLRLLVHLPLRRLPPDEVRLLVSSAVGGAVAPALAELIAERSQGNPFFAEELVYDLVDRAALVRSGGQWQLNSTSGDPASLALPLTLRLAIDSRMERLAEETRTALTAAAVLGRTFDERILSRMLGCSLGKTEAALAAGHTAGLISSTKDGSFFVHDTVREAIYDGATGEHRRWHTAAADAIAVEAAAAGQSARYTALAHHWQLAGEPVRAAAAALAAAAVLTGQAPVEALTYARLGHELRQRAGSDDVGTIDLLEAGQAHGEAALLAGEYAEAETALRAALAAAHALGDARRQGELWLRLGIVYKRREAPDEAAGCLHTAIELLDDGTSDLAALAEALTELAGLEGMTRAHYDEAEQLAGRAIAMAERLGEPRLEAAASLALANTRGRHGDPAIVRPLLQHALERALAGDHRALAAEVCATLANTCYWIGELTASHEYAERRLDLARQTGDVFGLRHAHSWLANLAWSRGDWHTARRLLNEARPLLARLGSPEPIAFLQLIDGMIDYRTGDFARADEQLSGAIAQFEQVGSATAVWYAGWLPLVYLALGRDGEAEQQLRSQERRIEALPPSALPARSARNLLALAYAQLGDRERGAACEAALRPYAGDYHWSPARRSLAALAALRGDTATARADLGVAEVQARREGMLPDLALILLRRAELPPDSGGETAASHDREEGSRLLRVLGMESALTVPPVSASAPVLPGNLTPREFDVLRLLAQGKTNREIAAALVISERTAINHVSHILAKLDVEHRSGAVAYALRHGLA